MKRALRQSLLLALCAVVLLGLSACAGQRGVLEVEGGKIPRDIYLYYLDHAYSDAVRKIGENKDVARSNIDGKTGKDWMLDRAEEYCREFVAVATKFQEEQLVLTPEEKGNVSSKVAAQWSVNSAHYLRLGLTKTVLTRVAENEVKRESLFTRYYDTGGVNAVAEEELKAWYQEHYVGFIAINGYLTTEDVTGNTVKLNSDQEKQLTESFTKMAESISAGTAVGDAAATNEATKNQELRESVIFENGSGYPEGFYKEVRAIPVNKAQVVKMENYIYVVKRIDVMGADGALYQASRSEVLKACRGGEFASLISDIGKEYSVQSSKTMVQSCYRKVSGIR